MYFFFFLGLNFGDLTFNQQVSIHKVGGTVEYIFRVMSIVDVNFRSIGFWLKAYGLDSFDVRWTLTLYVSDVRIKLVF